MHENPLLIQQHSPIHSWLFVRGLQPSQGADYLYFFPLEAQPHKISVYYSAHPVSVALMISALSLYNFAAGVGYRVNTSVAIFFLHFPLSSTILELLAVTIIQDLLFPALQAVL